MLIDTQIYQNKYHLKNSCYGNFHTEDNFKSTCNHLALPALNVTMMIHHDESQHKWNS